MTSTLPFHAIVVAGGSGSRTGLSQPKQYVPLHGSPILVWSVRCFARLATCQSVIVVVPAGDEAMCASLLGDYRVTIVAGGSSRQRSVAAGLAALPAEPANDAVVLVHDAARPGLDPATVQRLLGAFSDPEIAGVVPVLPVADTLARNDGRMGEAVSRAGLLRVQTPQGFRVGALRTAHCAAPEDDATDDAQLVRRHVGPVATVAGDGRLDKITTSDDFERMSAMLHPGWRTAVATGFDVHRLVAGDGLWLGGIWIAHDRKLDGHSDADVLLHAVTDAILGTIGDGDIGSHFPPTDQQWRGASSDRFLTHARDLLGAAGGRLDHVDCTVICEAPKVGPHRSAIRENLARLLDLPLSHVSVKATTTERLGFTGRGEGMAAQAVVTVRIPHAESE